MENKSNNIILTLVSLILLFISCVARLIPHPWNFTPALAMAMFGGFVVAGRIWGILIPLLFVWISDLLVNNILYRNFFNSFVWFYDGFYWQYGAYAMVALLSGIFLKASRLLWVIPSSILGSLLFFMISNFGVWATGNMYPKNFTGLMECYVAAIPFFKGTLGGTLAYSVILFGIYDWVKKKYFRPQTA
ncbi:MAG: hypothetical protein N3F09_04475 [Bacteroidia bacterium]|nr:hypothetical protein [Bacteroidia bacterium]